MTYVPGKSLVIGVALSADPLPHNKEDEKQAGNVTEYIGSVQATWPTAENKLSDIKVATARDMTLQVLAEYITNGWPSKDAIPVKVQAFYPASPDLFMSD